MKFFALFINTNLFLLFFLILMIPGCINSGKESGDQSSDTVSKTISNKKESPRLVYDNQGNITERHSVSYRQKDNSVRSRDSYYYKYDEHKNVIEETKKSHDPNGNLVFKNVNFYYFNDLNQKVEQKFFSYDANDVLNQQSRNTYSYDKDGNVLQEKSWYENGSLKSIINSSRNSEGYLTAEEYINFDIDGTKKYHKKFHYSKYGLEKTEDLMQK